MGEARYNPAIIEEKMRTGRWYSVFYLLSSIEIQTFYYDSRAFLNRRFVFEAWTSEK